MKTLIRICLLQGLLPREIRVPVPGGDPFNIIDLNLLFSLLTFFRISEPSADPEDLELLSPDEREKRRSFEAKSERNIVKLKLKLDMGIRFMCFGLVIRFGMVG